MKKGKEAEAAYREQLRRYQEREKEALRAARPTAAPGVEELKEYQERVKEYREPVLPRP